MILSLLLLTFYCLISYALLIPFLGFYSEDFFFAYIGHFYGSEGLIKSLSIDRPLNGYLLSFSYSLLKDNVFLWHTSTFLIRLLGGYVLFFTLLKLWPTKLGMVTTLVLLFLIYPGFLQQTLPLGYQVHIIGLTTWVISLLFTVLAVQAEKRVKVIAFTLIAVILQLFTFFNLEFFIGMEILRFLFIVYIRTGSQINLLKLNNILRYSKNLSPYISSLAIFILWRIFIFKSNRPETDINFVTQTYYSDPVWILKIPIEIIQSFFQTLILAYFLPSIINLIRIPIHYFVIAIFIGILSTFLLYLYFKHFNLDIDKRLGKNLILIGFISIIGALIPIIISGRFVRVFMVYDRYTITSILAVSLLLVGILTLKFLYPIRKWIILFLVFISIMSHLLNGFYRVDYWDKQKDLWWQLYWRAPKIESGAMLILDFPEVSENTFFKSVINKMKFYQFYWVEEQIWTTGNLFFNYNIHPSQHFYGDFLDNTDTIEKIKNGVAEEVENRGLRYTRDFKNHFYITAPSDTSCLKTKDSDFFRKQPSKPPLEIFGSEPPHTWCYFFQKASLARQFKDWESLARLRQEVKEKNLQPKNPNEWLPFEENLR